MDDKLPRGYNYKIDNGDVIFIGKIEGKDEVHISIRDKNNKYTRIILSDLCCSALSVLLENRNDYYKEDELFVGDEGIKYGVKVTNFDVPKKQKEPQKKPLFDLD